MIVRDDGGVDLALSLRAQRSLAERQQESVDRLVQLLTSLLRGSGICAVAAQLRWQADEMARLQEALLRRGAPRWVAHEWQHASSIQRGLRDFPVAT